MLALLASVAAALLVPGTASAHGPVNPAATSYQATVREMPAGLNAKVVDGDQRLWLQASPTATVVVIDYRGAPYLRFTPRGVQVNRNSSMYYLNQVPAEAVPPNLGAHAVASWESVTSGHAYEWHDGRLHALATTALAPGTRYVGRWSIPLRIGNRPAVIAGGLRYAPNPSLVWFWPIFVAVACVLAGIRVRRRVLDLRIARALALACTVAFVILAFGEQLHGRPNVSAGQLVVLVLMLAFAFWALRGLVLGSHNWFGFFLIAVAAVYEGANLAGVLVHGFVLVALPALVARTAVVVCLAAGAALLPVIFRIADQPDRVRASVLEEPDLAWDDEAAWE